MFLDCRRMESIERTQACTGRGWKHYTNDKCNPEEDMLPLT